jgi:large subunit ribosomal protein L13
MKTINVKPADVKREWFIIDAAGKPLGRVAAKAAAIVRGKEKPVFTPNEEYGDFVVIINAAKVSVSGTKPENKLYRHHTGFPGGLKTRNFSKMMEVKPTFPLEHAVKGMLPKGPLGRALAKNVKVYAGAAHPHKAQNPTAIEL